jgi:carbamate kinase
MIRFSYSNEDIKDEEEETGWMAPGQIIGWMRRQVPSPQTTRHKNFSLIINLLL